MDEFHVVVAGVPYGYQGDFSDGRWLTPEHIRAIEGTSPQVRLSHPSAGEMNAGWSPDAPVHAVLVETSGALKSWEDLPAVVFAEPFLRLISPSIVFVQSCSAGVEQLTPILDPSVTLCNASGVHAPAIAESVLASILVDAKMLYQRRVDQQKHEWNQLPCRELMGAVMCVLGTGHIGSATARLAQAFGIETVGVSRSGTPAEHFDAVVTPDGLGDVLSRSDYLVIACPLTEETRGMIGATELKLLKNSAYIANVARGAIIDEPALVSALRDGEVRAAFLDCLVEEPLPDAHPLWDMPNVDVSPHDSHASQLLGDHHVALFVDNLKRHFAGEPLRNVVDASRGY